MQSNTSLHCKHHYCSSVNTLLEVFAVWLQCAIFEQYTSPFCRFEGRNSANRVFKAYVSFSLSSQNACMFLWIKAMMS